MGLIFSVAEFNDEIETLTAIAGDFLAPGHREILGGLAGQVRTLLDAGGPIALRIEPDFPIRTTVSWGGYERGNGGEHAVLAEVTCLWEVRPLGQRKRRAIDRAFAIDGIASTVIAVHRELDEGRTELLGSWRLEVAHDSGGSEPGSYLHMQHGGAGEGLGDVGLPVPRIPVGLYTPMLAVEFVIAELFQEAWLDKAAGGLSQFATWRELQTRRAARVNTWLNASLRDGSEGTALLRMKKARPPADMFVEGRYKPVDLRR